MSDHNIATAKEPAIGSNTVVRVPLSPKQLRVYQRIKKLILSKPFGPSFREIGRACNISSTRTVAIYIKVLVRKGWLRHGAGDHRALVLTEMEPKKEVA